MNSYILDWSRGPTAEIEVSESSNGGDYLLSYTPPMRSTLRHPPACTNAEPSDLESAETELSITAQRVRGIRAGHRLPNQANVAQMQISALKKLENAGNYLYQFLKSEATDRDLRQHSLFVEVGTDDKLARYPWELAYNPQRQNFICLDHYLGRFVRMKTLSEPRMQRSESSSVTLDELRVLVISVPEAFDRIKYPFLDRVIAETETLRTVFGKPGRISAKFLCNHSRLSEEQPTFDNVLSALSSGDFHVVHFCGHAEFDETNPRNSALLLRDKRLSVKRILNVLNASKPSVVFSFINACETGRIGGAGQGARDWDSVFNPFGLARAFLERGSYLLGSRWDLVDKAAAVFARSFYEGFLAGEPIGKAITEARRDCKNASSEDDLSWAAYVYYGDPRLSISDNSPQQRQRAA